MHSNLFHGNFFYTNCLCMYHLQQTQYYNVEAVWKCNASLIAKWYHTATLPLAIFVTFLRKRQQQQWLDLMWAVTINWNAPWFAFPTLHNDHHKKFTVHDPYCTKHEMHWSTPDICLFGYRGRLFESQMLHWKSKIYAFYTEKVKYMHFLVQ